MFVHLAGILFLLTTLATADKTGCLSESQFACDGGKCIPLSWRCDGDEDCPKADDEKDCKPVKCNAQEFQCEGEDRDTSGPSLIPLHAIVRDQPARCIPLSWQCDGETDCRDGSDEKACPAKKAVCDKEEFTCNETNGHPQMCIPLSWRCDGQNDCADLSDETHCEQKRPCGQNEFTCNNSVCIFKNWKCDGDDDCGDNSDEDASACENHESCDQHDKFRCISGGTCIPRTWLCDGEADCKDRSDEVNCTDAAIANARQPHPVICHHEYEFRCRTGGQCINVAWKCDGDVDCADGSDEDECPRKQCRENEKSCDRSTCLPASKWCDGNEDCFDGSDEKDCPDLASKKGSSEECSDRDYKCASTPLRCIPYEKLCDGKSVNNDCIPSVCNMKIHICEPKTNSACHCRNTGRNGSICACATGYQLVGDSCVDIDECAERGICAQKCVNLDGGYRCECHPGYYLTMGKDTSSLKSGGICRAKGSDPLLLLSNRATIRRFDLVTSKYMPLVGELDSAVAMDFLHRNDTLIWSDVGQEKIMICHMGKKLSLNNVNDCDEKGGNLTLVDKEVSTPDGLAVDWVHQLLFWTDTGLDQINVVDLVSRRRRTLFSEGLDEPRAIAVDPLRGLIFWTDWGVHARIERAGMDGNNRVAIVQGDSIKWPNGLALDILEQRVYWADAKVKTIMCCDYWGGDLRVILKSHEQLKHPFSLTVFEERLYWTDWDYEGVLSANKFTGKEVRRLMNNIPGPMTVRVYHELAQPPHPNKCFFHNCEHMCLPRAHLPATKESSLQHGPAYSCACANGYVVRVGAENFCVREDEEGDFLKSSSTFSFTSILFLLLCASCFVLGYMWYRRRPGRFVVLHVDNPVYRRTVEEMDADMDPFTDSSTVPASDRDVKLVIDEQHQQQGGLGSSNTSNPPIPSAPLPTDSMTAPLTTSMVM